MAAILAFPFQALIALLRLLRALLGVLMALVICLFIGVISRPAFATIAMYWHRYMLSCFDVRRVQRGASPPVGTLLISNHISWMDILVLGGSWRVVFLATHQIGEWFALGWIIRRAGTLFIERGRGAQHATAQICAALQQGKNVLLFPEGKTTDGTSVIRFQPRLLQAALDAGAAVQPIALRYINKNGEREPRNSFAGEITLMQSLWQTARGRPFRAEITTFPPLQPQPTQSRHELATQVEELVRGIVETKQ